MALKKVVSFEFRSKTGYFIQASNVEEVISELEYNLRTDSKRIDRVQVNIDAEERTKTTLMKNKIILEKEIEELKKGDTSESFKTN